MLCIIPARGGSKGIRRKALRQVHGIPLIRKTIDLASAGNFERIVVSTDSITIAQYVESLDIPGIELFWRATPTADTQPLIYPVREVVEKYMAEKIVVMQPTCPNLTENLVKQFLNDWEESGRRSAISVSREDHLYWLKDKPLFSERLNRQQMDTEGVYRESGGLQAAYSADLIHRNGIIGPDAFLFLLSPHASLDIDSWDDLRRARRTPAEVSFYTTGNRTTGMGHLRRALAIADELSDYRVTFRTGDTDTRDLIIEYGYTAELPRAALGIAIFDLPKIEEPELRYLTSRAELVVLFEERDLQVARHADLLFDELRLTPIGHPREYLGPQYAIIRPEFIRPISRFEGHRVLVVFGGNAERSKEYAELLNAYASGSAIKGQFEFQGAKPEEFIRQSKWADIFITGYGRTVNEAAFMGKPCIALAANSRELTHEHRTGVFRLGHIASVRPAQVIETLLNISQKVYMSATVDGLQTVDGFGLERVARTIEHEWELKQLGRNIGI